MTYPLLKKAPKDHNSPEFIDFIRANNKVVFECEEWIVIRNCKYWTKKTEWLTAFWKHSATSQEGYILSLDNSMWYDDIKVLWHVFSDYEWVKKASSKQSVKRFHIHLIKR